MSDSLKLSWHSYKYYPYERHLALREAEALLGAVPHETGDGIELAGNFKAESVDRLVYFSQIHDRLVTRDTIQAQLERAVTAGRNRQATRYSAHGIHEYKGKFNPQVAKAILNIFGVRRGDHVLDPFCGSGTTLVEAVQLGADATGFDINPLAAFLANAKLASLRSPASELAVILSKLQDRWRGTKSWPVTTETSEAITYLRKWFDIDNLDVIEKVRTDILEEGGEHASILLAVASNLLREYSLQDPNDLRIRRRSDPTPEIPFWHALIGQALEFIAKLSSSQLILGTDLPIARVTNIDVVDAGKAAPTLLFDAAITSPPYAMALPYVDTQRLSLVWLRLVEPRELLPLEATLIGSRETRGPGKREWMSLLNVNGANLPKEEYDYCSMLAQSLAPSDGFRRKAVPSLLYRYFTMMRSSFVSVSKRLAPRAPYALIVGHNHTVLGGVRQDIDTPRHLAALGASVGWEVEELIPLQTYRRYGYHQNNAVNAETLILLRNQ
jgi:site-specific DNA-methyltransferase (cytosine-N4-specific)